MAEVGGQKAEDRRQRAEDGGGEIFSRVRGPDAGAGQRHAYAWILNFELSEGGRTTLRASQTRAELRRAPEAGDLA